MEPEHKVTPGDLRLAIRQFYEEIETYKMPGEMKILDRGVHVTEFIASIDRLREWGDRILAMKRRVSVWKTTVRPQAVSRKRYWEREVAGELVFGDTPTKGVTAKDRRSLAEAKFSRLEDDLREWEEVEKALGDLYQDLTDKYRQIVDSKQDIRANLMSLRMQLVLERAGTDLAEMMTDHGLKKASRYLREARGPDSDPDDVGGPNDPVAGFDPKELDDLLSGKA